MTTHNTKEGITDISHFVAMKSKFLDEENWVRYIVDSLAQTYHQELQKDRETWLREEIVKLKGMKKDEVKWKKDKYDVKSVDAVLYNRAVQTIIDRYQSELDQPNK